MWIAQSTGGVKKNRLHLDRGVRPPPYSECPGYDTKLSYSKALAMWIAPSLQLLPGPLWPGVIAPDWISQIVYQSNRTVWHLIWV